MEYEYFDKHFFYNTSKKRHPEKFGSFFLLDTLKTTLLMRNFNNKRTQSEHIFKKSGHFLWFTSIVIYFHFQIVTKISKEINLLCKSFSKSCIRSSKLTQSNQKLFYKILIILKHDLKGEGINVILWVVLMRMRFTYLRVAS